KLRQRLYLPIDLASFVDEVNHSEWLPEELWEVASLAQHYGIPTRLLDWTYDVFTAAYFSSLVHDAESAEGDICVWAFNLGEMAFSINSRAIPLSIVIPHYSNNTNISAQSGLFTLTRTQNIDVELQNFLQNGQHVKTDYRPLDERL